MSLDERLRATMAAHGASVTPAYDPLDEVTEGARHSRRKALVIRLAVALAAIVALAAAVPIVGSAHSAPADPAGVPWVDQPEDLGDAAADRADPLDCGPDAVEVVEGRGVGDGHYGLTVRNISTAACSFRLRPEFESHGPNGAVTPIPASETPESGDYVRMPDVYLGAGQSASALIGVPIECAGHGRPTTYTNVYAVVGDHSLHLDDRITTTCGLLVSRFNEDAHPNGLVMQIPLLRPLEVTRVHTPAAVTAGRPFDFQVAFDNPSTAPVAMSACPSYAVSFASTARGYVLNCAGVTIPAGGRQWFDIRVTVPAGLAPGAYALTWWLRGYPAPEVVAVDVQP